MTPVCAQADNPASPAEPVKLIFIHHSVGENWLADGDGNLGRTLGENIFFVSDTNYGWGPDSIGDATDYHNWLDWFLGPESSRYLDALYNENEQNSYYTRSLSDPGGENEIIMFKSCFPNSDLGGNPGDPPSDGEWYTVGHAKYVYNQLLDYFVTRLDKLFVVITMPPLLDPTNAENARSFCQWLVEDWLAENNYPYSNVAVWDLHNILTHPDNHHRFQGGAVEYTIYNGPGTLYYDSDGDEHPNEVGNQKATAEFVTMMNVFYNRWRAGAPARVDGEPEPEPETTTEGNIHVRVLDQEHNPLRGVTVYSTSQPAGQSSLSGVTSADGSIAFNDIKPGSYVFRAMMSGYESSSVSGGVESDETMELTLSLTEEVVEEETGSGLGGIPGFPFISIILGLVIVASIIMFLRRARAPI